MLEGWKVVGDKDDRWDADVRATACVRCAEAGGNAHKYIFSPVCERKAKGNEANQAQNTNADLRFICRAKEM